MSPEWLAGFFDGEGCITLVGGEGRRGHITPSIVFTNTCKATLELIQLEYGGRLFSKGRKVERWSEAWMLVFAGREQANRLARILLPFSVTKKAELEFYLTGQDVLTGGRQVRGVSDDLFRRRLEFKQGLSAFKSRTKIKTEKEL